MRNFKWSFAIAITLVMFVSGVLSWTTTSAEAPRKAPSAPNTLGLVSYLKFDEGSGTTALDSSGNGYTGTLSSGVTFTTAVAPIGISNPFAAQFDGSTGIVTLPGTAPLTLTQAATFDIWIYFNQLPSDTGHPCQAISKEGNGNDLDLGVDTDNRVKFYVGSGTHIDSTFAVQAQTWYRLTATYQANTLMAMYVNGWLNNSLAIGFTRGDSGNPIAIGEGTVFTNRHCNSIIDDVHIYDTAVPPPPPPPLVAYLKFDEGSGTIALDSSGNNLTGTLSSGVSYTTTVAPITPTNPYAAQFDGVTGIVTLSKTAPITFTQTATFDAWVFFNQLPSSAGHTMALIGKSNGANDLDLQAETDNRIKFYVGSGNHVDTSTVIIPKCWYRVTATYQANTAETIYLNGGLQATAGIGFARSDGGNPIAIGENLVFTGRHLNGIVDDVHIYDSVQPPTSINPPCMKLYLPLILR